MALLLSYPRQQGLIKYDANIISNGYASGGLSSIPKHARPSARPCEGEEEGNK